MSGYYLYVFVVILGLSMLVQDAESGCNAFKKCCKGKENTCRAKGPRITKPNATSCFCDETCSILGDCCTDYKQVCKPKDCVTADHWGYWSECSESCGWGYKNRTRNIIQNSANGGKPCGRTVQKTFCLGIKCKGRRQSHGGLQEAKETGKIVPAKFGTWRKNKLYNPYTDIRKNLFHHYGKEQKVQRPSYCAKFEIIASRKACQTPLSGNWAKGLEEGHTICVECQPSAMKKSLGVRCKGHGVYKRATRWNAVTVPGCHGRWIMTTQSEQCSCNPEDKNSFIFI